MQIIELKILALTSSLLPRKMQFCEAEVLQNGRKLHYVNVSVLNKFSQKTSVFTLSIVSSP